MKRTTAIFSCVIILLFGTGCWDRIEIEERGFVIGSAVDLINKNEQIILTDVPDEIDENAIEFMLTNEQVVPGTVAEKATGGETYTISATGDTFIKASRAMVARNSQSPFYEHLTLVVFSEGIARSGFFPKTLDILLREPQFNRGITCFIAEGEARKVLEVKPKNKEMTSMYIQSISDNHFRNMGIQPEQVTGDLHEYSLRNRSFALPRIRASEDEVMVSGSAVFNSRDKTMVGFLSDEQTQGLVMLMNDVRGGALQVQFRGGMIGFDLNELKTKIKADVDDPDRISFKINIKAEGELNEKHTKFNPMDQADIEELQKLLNKEVERIITSTLEALQQDMHTDPISLGGYVERNHPKVWKRIGSDWDQGENYFSKCEIDVTASVHINARGTINMSHG